MQYEKNTKYTEINTHIYATRTNHCLQHQIRPIRSIIQQ